MANPPARKAGPSSGTTNTSAATTALWDPCTQVSDALLKQVGVNPATKESGIAGVEESDWKVCSWNNADFDLVVSALLTSLGSGRC
ncbi:DUF3558 family protein [Nocardia sp. GCM10030253]|uniref:DUF3558 family protein n=1 Tax=Nocardia sp. GCM10030253 TaxID=3273404 RepID=UPI003644EA51